MLSLLPHTKIRIIDGEQTKLAVVSELVGWHRVEVYDFYGNKHKITISAGKCPSRWLVQAFSGEMQQFGADHTILARTVDAAGFTRVPLSAIDGPRLIRLPQKKTTPPKGVSNFLDLDEKSGALFLAPTEAKDLQWVLEEVASCGVTVNRHPTSLRIDLETRRPVCFASKLINGNFQSDFSFTMNDLASRGIVQPWKLFGDAVIEDTKRTGIIFEGNCIYNDVPFTRVREVKKEADVCNVHLDDPMTPVEITWFIT